MGPRDRPRYEHVKLTYSYNVRNVHTHIGIRKTRNWFRYETFYYLFEFKFFWHEKRETQFLSMLTFLFDPTTFSRTQLVLPRRDQKSTCFLLTRISTNYFSSNLKILSPTYRHDVIHVPGLICYLGFLLWHLWFSHPPRTRVNTCT